MNDTDLDIHLGTSGIGFSVAEGALEHGALVTISGSNQSRIDSTIKQLQSSYPHYASNVTGHVVDLSDSSTLEPKLHDLFKAVTSNNTNPIHHIAFTAGDRFKFTPLSEFDPTDPFQVTHVRLIAPMLIGKVAPAHMAQDGSGSASLTFTSGSNTAKPAKGWTTLVTWAAGIEGLTRGLAVDLAPQVRVNCISPGAIRTPLLERTPEKILESLKEGNLLKAIGRPEDTAEAYLYAMRDSFVTGQVILTDGGRTLV